MSKILEKDITFIVTTFKSEKLIESCLENLPKESKKIIVENNVLVSKINLLLP